MRLRLALGAAVGIIAATAAVMLFFSSSITWSRDDSSLTPSVDVPTKLIEAGFPEDLAKAFSDVTTEVVSSGPGRAHIVQQVPSLGLRQETYVAIRPDVQLATDGLRTLQTSAGPQVYPLHHALTAVPGGVQRHTVVFLPYNGIDPTALQQLSLQRRSAVPGTHTIAYSSATQASVLGVVISSITTTTDSGGSGLDTTGVNAAQQAIPAEAPDHTLGNAANQAIPVEAPAKAPEVVVVQAPEQWGDGAAGPTQQQIQEWRDHSRALPPESERLTQEQFDQMRRSNRVGERLRGEAAFERWESANRAPTQTAPSACGGAGSAPSAASNAIPNVLHAANAAATVLEARSQFQATASDLHTGSDQIDAYAKRAAGNSGNTIADALAQAAQTADPLGTQRTAERVAEAREDLVVNTAARVINTALGAAASLVLPGAAGPIAQLTTSVNDAMLREAQSTMLADLAPRAPSERTGQAQAVIQNAQNPAPTNSLGDVTVSNNVPSVDNGAVCEALHFDPGAGEALIVLNATEEDERVRTFKSVVHLGHRTGAFGSIDAFSGDFVGSATGQYKEIGTRTVDACGGYRLVWAGEATAKVLARADSKEVSVLIGGPMNLVSGTPPTYGDVQDGCWSGYDIHALEAYRAGRPYDLGTQCVFVDVDFTRPGIYIDPPSGNGEPTRCTLNIGALKP